LRWAPSIGWYATKGSRAKSSRRETDEIALQGGRYKS
jgi:hypothetical protein